MLKYTDYNKYVAESPEIVIRKLLSIRIEREKSLKALKHAKNIFFDQKLHFFTQISECLTCTHLHHLDLDSGGQVYLEMTKIFSAYAKTMCWWNSSRLTGQVRSSSIQYWYLVGFPMGIWNIWTFSDQLSKIE